MAQVKSLNCPNCGYGILDTSTACPACGSRVILSDDRQKFVLAGTLCPKCGLDNKEQHRFCSKCGEKLFKECQKCFKEMGLDSIHCPFCGDNVDTSTKEREIELARHKDRLSRIGVLKLKVAQLEQKKTPFNDELDKLSKKACNRINYSEDGYGMYFFFLYPIGALILSFIVYGLGITSFVRAFIGSYFGIFFWFYIYPSIERNRLKGEIEVIKKEIEVISKEIQATLNEIASLDIISAQAIRKYRIY